MLEKLRAALTAKERELTAKLKRRDGLAVEAQPDMFDEIQDALDRALVIGNLDRTSALLRDVRAALARAEDGSYGLCLRCEEEINPKRLAAVPWAALCLRCQERADHEGSTGRDGEEAPGEFARVQSN
jgi:DnaK suppressor protein